MVPALLPPQAGRATTKESLLETVMSLETHGPKRREPRFRRARASRTEDTGPDLSTPLSQTYISEAVGDPGPPHHSAGAAPGP